MLKEKRFVSYLIYALGEVAIIIVGVLLAMQINNWNEKRKENHRLQDIYKRIALDIDNNQASAEAMLEQYEAFKFLYDRVLQDSVSPDLIEQGLGTLVTGLIVYDYDKTGVDQLRDMNTQDSVAIQVIRLYDIAEIHLKAAENIIIASINDNLKNWSEEKTWFRSYVKGEYNAEALDYFLESAEYRNRVAYIYLMLYESYLPTIKEFVKTLEALKQKLQTNQAPN